MPKLQHVFASGKMNKDLDERLVPNGEYRDALNIQITKSTNSGVGVVENILGNSLKDNKDYNPSTGLHTKWDLEDSTLNEYGFDKDTARCIATLRDDRTECIYFIVVASNKSAIIEYNQSIDVITPVLVDFNNVLKLSKFITGINMIEGLLFFTDDNSEPKKVNINVFKEASIATGFNAHTRLYNRDFNESDVTVIKKSPLTAPLIEAKASKREGAGTGTSPIVVNQNFTQLINGGSNFESIPAGTDITLSWVETPNYKVGDILVMAASYVDDKNYVNEFDMRVSVVSVNSPLTSVVAKILNIPSNLPNQTLTWEILLEENGAMFQYKFPRFAYRWKYRDGEYSTYSPFSEIAFIPGKFEYVSSDGYNLGMINNIRYLKVYGFDTPPEEVAKVEVLYKDADSTVIYTVSELKEGLNYLEIESEIVHSVVESNQLLRPWDNVPRKAKAQEIISNRVIYGNYLQNYNVPENSAVTLWSEPVAHPSVKDGVPSIKSIRTYQAGVVFKDAYGRETPVFTNTKASTNIDRANADKVNSLSAVGVGDAPDWATHFKYFIKETSDEYYNLALDRFYLAEDGNVWLSFPSSERNKLDLDTYLILKKKHDSDQAITDATARYKILDIKNEAPLFIATVLKSVGNGTCTLLSTSRPEPGSLQFSFDGPVVAENPAFAGGFVSGNSIVISSGANQTVSYEISGGGPTGVGNKYTVSLNEPIGTEAAFLSSLTTGDTIDIRVQAKVVENKPEFEGRFFAKINRNAAFDTYIINAFAIKNERYGVLEEADVPNSIANNGPGDGTTGFGFKDSNAPSSYWTTKMQKPKANSDWFGIGWSAYAGGEGSPIDVGLPTHPIIDDYLSKTNTSVRFYDAAGNLSQVYTLKGSTTGYSRRGWNGWGGARTTNSNAVKFVTCTLDRKFEAGFTPVGIQIVRKVVDSNNDILSSNNPAVFETEPKKGVELDIYYEASDALPISQYKTPYKLNWFNCYSFGNGVESDRIRDDFNALRIGKGVKVSAPLAEQYKEERRSSGLIFSGIFNSISGVNKLNQFVQAEAITKDLNPYYGSIQKLHARDSDIIALCEDKIIKILADKDALYNADGSANVTYSANVLGQAVPFAGEFGISKNPESFATYGFRSYFSDKSRGVVLRLSVDGLTLISEKGMTGYFGDALGVSDFILGSYDDLSDVYNITLNNATLSFDEGADGWSTRKSFIPEAAVSLNNIYYTFKDGLMWSHDNQTRNKFYNDPIAKSSLQFVINEEPSNIKNIKTLSYEGSAGWTTPSITTDQQDGYVPGYIPKEGIYYNFIKGKATTWDNGLQTGSLDSKEFSTQGIGMLSSISGSTNKTVFKLTIKENND
jgi:hypothetical protein